MNLYMARVISLGTAVMVGYLLHRYFTFGGIHQGCFYRQMAGHFGVHLSGGLINYGIFSLIIVIGHNILDRGLLLNFLPLIAIWIGGLVGLSFNFFFSKKLVFQSKTQNASVTP
jgi:putative flippase GtrA